MPADARMRFGILQTGEIAFSSVCCSHVSLQDSIVKLHDMELDLPALVNDLMMMHSSAMAWSGSTLHALWLEILLCSDLLAADL